MHKIQQLLQVRLRKHQIFSGQKVFSPENIVLPRLIHRLALLSFIAEANSLFLTKPYSAALSLYKN